MQAQLKLFLTLLCLMNVWFVHGQIITTVAGGATGHGGSWGDGGPATAAEINFFAGLAVDNAGNIFISDGHRIRKVNAISGVINTIAGTGIAGYNGDGIPATAAQLYTPVCISFDATENLYVYDAGNHRIRRIDAVTGIITTYAGNGTFGFTGDSGAATAATIDGGDMAWDANGNLYYGSTRKIRKISSTGIISTFAGNGLAGVTAEGVPATSTYIAPARGLAIDVMGNLYIADSTRAIRKITASSGLINRIAGTGDNLYTPYGGDGIPATLCRVGAFDIYVDDTGNLYISDQPNSRIEKVNTHGVIYTIAGTGVAGFGGDNNIATNAQVSYPENVVLDKCNNVYIADFNNKRVRKVTYHATCDNETSKVKSVNIENNFIIYPNPANSNLTIKTSEKINTINFTNLFGQTIPITAPTITNNKAEINIAHLPRGMYIIRVNEVYVQRFMKE